MFTMLKNFSKGRLTYVIVHAPVDLIPPAWKMWWMWDMLKSLKTLAVSKKSFPKKWIWSQEPFCVFSQKTFVSKITKNTLNISSTLCLRRRWIERLNKLSRVYSKNLFKKILFVDEKIFTTEQKFNKKNDKVYVWILYKAKAKVPRIQRGPKPSSVMVSWEMLWNGYCDSFLHVRSENDSQNLWKNHSKAQ